MTYPVTQLISEAFYTSGIVSRQFQTVAGDQEEAGILKLNEILTDTTIETDMIPYYTTAYNFTLVTGQESYFIPNLTELETFCFFIDSVRYQTEKKQKDKYFGSGRADNVLSLPFSWNCERVPGGSNLFLYFFPQGNYLAQITGWFGLNQVSLNQDLTSPLATANLGAAIFLAPITSPPTNNILNTGALVVNGIDLAGSYLNVGALVYYINNGTMSSPGPKIPFVSASLSPSGQLILTNISSGNISISSNGANQLLNGITFSAFNIMGGVPLSQTFFPMYVDQFYINYLQYRLADRLCSAYNFILPPGPQRQLDKYMLMISKKSSPKDLSLNKISTLTQRNSINYGQVNLGHGWTT